MALQIVTTLKARPIYSSLALAIALVFSVTFLYFDFFLFFQPQFVFFVSPDRLGLFLLNFGLAIMSGLVITLSIFQIRNMPRVAGTQTKAGFAGIIAALIAGACPCYYLVPILALSSGAGGILLFVGSAFNTFEVPIKLGSFVLLGFVAFTLERSLRASCKIDPRGKTKN